MITHTTTPTHSTATDTSTSMSPRTSPATDVARGPEPSVDLRHHGDAEVAAGLVDLAVNVRPGTPPPWLAAELRRSVADVAAYPDRGPARAVVARRHDRP